MYYITTKHVAIFGIIWTTVLAVIPLMVFQKLKEVQKSLKDLENKQASAEMADSLLTKALQLTEKGNIDLSVNSAGRDIENG